MGPTVEKWVLVGGDPAAAFRGTHVLLGLESMDKISHLLSKIHALLPLRSMRCKGQEMDRDMQPRMGRHAYRITWALVRTCSDKDSRGDALEGDRHRSRRVFAFLVWEMDSGTHTWGFMFGGLDVRHV